MKRFLRAITAFVLISGVIFQAGLVSAQQSANSLSITPRRDFIIEKGESQSAELRVTNIDNELPLNLRIQVIDFQPQDETGAPQLIKDPNAAPKPWSIKPFVELPQQMTLRPGEAASLPIKVSIPANQGAGSYYGAIEYSVVNEAQENVTVSATSATLVFVKVPGEAKQQLDFIQFGAFVPNDGNTDGSFSSLFVNEKPKWLAYRLKNEGNIAEQPKGAMIIKNMFGKQIKFIENANPKAQVAILGQTRRFDVCMNSVVKETEDESGADIKQEDCQEPQISPGRYTAELSLVYGENGSVSREITAKTSFWYLPWWFIAVVLLGLAILIFAVLFVVNRVKDMFEHKRRRR